MIEVLNADQFLKDQEALIPITSDQFYFGKRF
jgi:hypothetical protein